MGLTVTNEKGLRTESTWLFEEKDTVSQSLQSFPINL